jgi:hypothetical protein
VSVAARPGPGFWHGKCIELRNDCRVPGITLIKERAMLEQTDTMEALPEESFQAVQLSGDMFGALINLSGRRRFTSQRVVLYAVLASMGHDGAIATARETLALFRDAHLTLVEGKGGLPGIFCGQLRDAYFGTLQGDRVIRQFIDLADATLAAITSDAKGAPALLDELVRSATPLLSVLNGLTLVYEEQFRRHAQHQQRELREMMGRIKTITKQARLVAFDAQIVAARAGTAGRDFASVAGHMTTITADIDDLVQQTLNGTLAP